MEAQHNGTTLEGVVKRLEALERENAQLRGKVATLEGSTTPKEEPSEAGIEGSDTVAEEQVSRKAMLAKAGAAAVAVAAAGTLLSPREAKAETFANVVSESYVQAQTFVRASGTGIDGISTSSSFPGVRGESQNRNNTGVVGVGNVGVRGSGDSAGVEGRGSTGVRGEGNGEGNAGVFGQNPTGTGVRGDSSESGYSGVLGLHQGASGLGVLGVATGAGTGVLGQCASGAGVEGGASRYGGKFAGSRAQLLLVPKGTTGRPTTGTHTKGEIYLDSAGAIFVCTRSGTPGTWKKVTTTSA